MLQTVLILFSIVGLGFLAKKIKLLNQTAADALQQVVLKITLPAVVMQAFINTSLGFEHAKLVTLGVVSVFVITGFYLLVYRFIFKDKALYATAIPISFFSNAGFLGFPIIESLFGQKGLSLAVPFQVFSHGSLFILTVGLFTLIYFGKADQNINIKKALKQVFYSPIIAAIPLGIFFHFASLPAPLAQLVSIAADANTFLIMLAVGLMLEPNKMSKQYIFPTAIVVFATLIVTPCLTFFLGKLLQLDSFSLQVAVTESAMPMAVVSLVIVRQCNLKVRLAESAFFVGTILSIITLPLIRWLLF